jgi:hypothetical protein
MACRAASPTIRPTVEEGIGADRQSRARLLGEGRECSIDLALVARGQYAQLPSALLRRRSRVPRFAFTIQVARIDEYGECGGGRELGEDFQPPLRRPVASETGRALPTRRVMLAVTPARALIPYLTAPLRRGFLYRANAFRPASVMRKQVTMIARRLRYAGSRSAITSPSRTKPRSIPDCEPVSHQD